MTKRHIVTHLLAPRSICGADLDNRPDAKLTLSADRSSCRNCVRIHNKTAKDPLPMPMGHHSRKERRIYILGRIMELGNGKSLDVSRHKVIEIIEQALRDL